MYEDTKDSAVLLLNSTATDIKNIPSTKMYRNTSRETSEDEFGAQELQVHDSARITKTNSNISELSRVISGIRDDREMDQLEYQEYSNRPETEQVILEELDRVLRATTRRKSDQESQRNESPEEEDEEEEDDGPAKDQGYAWVVAFMTQLCIFATWGSNAAWGVLMSNAKLPGSDFPVALQMDYAIIGSMVVCFAQALAPFSTILYKIFGHYYVFIIGIILQTVGYILSSFATKVWHLYITQGLLIGLSFTLIFLPATLILSTWFDKRKSMAMGIAVSGAGIGGVVFSLSLNKVIKETNDQRWAFRLLAIVDFIGTIIPLITLRPRNQKYLPLKETLNWETLKLNCKVIFDIKVFNNYPLCILAIWFGFAILGYILMLFTLASYGVSAGLSASQASNITAILNAFQSFGRPSLGYFGDTMGRNNLLTSVSLLICILLLAFWINATSYASLIVFSCILGFFIGIGSTMCQSMAADIIDTQNKLPAAWSGLNIVVGLFSMVSEVIAISLVVEDSPRPYLHTQIFSGCAFFFCFLLLLINREWLVRRTFKSRHLNALSSLKSKSGYLKTLGEEDLNNLEQRVERYQNLLRPTIINYFIRMFYPIRV